eukprot:349627-Chlamydomonas_euryale.AAC.7
MARRGQRHALNWGAFEFVAVGIAARPARVRLNVAAAAQRLQLGCVSVCRCGCTVPPARWGRSYWRGGGYPLPGR